MKEQTFIRWKDQLLAAAIDYPEHIHKDKQYPLLIICHGFVGSKVGVDRLFLKTAEALTREDMIVLRFDYCGCGESSGDYGKTGLDDLIDQTLTVLQFAESLQNVNTKEITLLGHSLGGATATLTAVMSKKIKRLILWSAVAQPYEDISRIVGKEQVDSLKNGESIDYLGYRFTKPFFASLRKHEPLQTAARFTGNVLLIHGTADEDIPVSYVNEYKKAFSKRHVGQCLAYEIQEANHTYSNGVHFEQLMEYTSHWIKEELEISSEKRTHIV